MRFLKAAFFIIGIGLCFGNTTVFFGQQNNDINPERSQWNNQMENPNIHLPRISRQRNGRLTQPNSISEGKLAQCTNGGFAQCSRPFPPLLTDVFRCSNDLSCPPCFKCCPNSCFAHKICARSRHVPTPSNDTAQCPEAGFKCSRPYSYDMTRIFECVCDEACPRGYRCCHQFCFQHRICVKVGNKSRNDAQKPPRRGIGNVTEGRVDVETTTPNVYNATNATTEIPNVVVTSTIGDNNRKHDPNEIIPDYEQYYEQYDEDDEEDEGDDEDDDDYDAE